jgi:hypothetical protein
MIVTATGLKKNTANPPPPSPVIFCTRFIFYNLIKKEKRVVTDSICVKQVVDIFTLKFRCKWMHQRLRIQRSV